MNVQRPKRKRVLFFGEGATLAHVVRPLELACSLDSKRFDIFYACDPRYEHLVSARNVEYVPIHSVAPEDFLKRVYKASALYTIDELREYVREDLKVITEVRPDIVVGDFRLSLGISAELCGVPYVALSNAHWSPSGDLECPVPEHPLVRILGVKVMRAVLRVTLPIFFGLQAKAFNRLRKSYGLPPVGGRGAHEVFTRGSRTLYLDIPELYDLGDLSDREGYIGPVNWKPDVALPEWWAELPTDRKVVFVTPGSSGDTKATLSLIRTLASMDVTVMLATAGRLDASDLPDNVYVTDFLPGLDAAKKADLVICNGGSGMVYQALCMGTPVLGIPKNIDQHYVMEALERQGAGKLIRCGRVGEENIRQVVWQMLVTPSFTKAACRLRFHLLRMDPGTELSAVMDDLVERYDECCGEARRASAASEREESIQPVRALAGEFQFEG